VTERPPLPIDDFKAAVAAELQASSPSEGGPGPDGSTAVSPQTGPAAFDPGTLTLEGMASAWQLPFWGLGWLLTFLRVLPGPDAVCDVGKKRAKDLARPSYAVYEHFAREYLGLHPRNAIHVSIGITGLNGVGILPELTEAIVKSRRAWIEQLKRAQQASQPAPPATS
jgi:hypothetical protein